MSMPAYDPRFPVPNHRVKLTIEQREKLLKEYNSLPTYAGTKLRVYGAVQGLRERWGISDCYLLRLIRTGPLGGKQQRRVFNRRIGA